MLLLLMYLGGFKGFFSFLWLFFFVLHRGEGKTAALRVYLNAEGNSTWVTTREVGSCALVSVSAVLW